jgi:hypothetical protein
VGAQAARVAKAARAARGGNEAASISRVLRGWQDDVLRELRRPAETEGLFPWAEAEAEHEEEAEATCAVAAEADEAPCGLRRASCRAAVLPYPPLGDVVQRAEWVARQRQASRELAQRAHRRAQRGSAAM